MLVGFIGAPYSGKTTTAAMLFGYLKMQGMTAEFLPEAARLYIAEKRYLNKVKGMEDKIQLSDQDQDLILDRQYLSETIMTTACGSSVIVVTDSCVLNTLLYMSEGYATNPEVVARVTQAINRYDLMLVSDLVVRGYVSDPNRIHSEAESKTLWVKLKALLKEYELEGRVVTLNGTPESRLGVATKAVMTMKSML